jgi:hypothetical protein
MSSLFPLRDRVVCAVCNWLLNHVASARYRAMIASSISYGMRAAADGYTPRPFHEYLDADDFAAMAEDRDA